MGFNATRRYRDNKWRDIAILVSAGVILFALIGWAAGLFG